MNLPTAQVQLLRQFVELCRANPQILHKPELAFFKEYLESMGAEIPIATEKAPASDDKPEQAASPPPKVVESEQSSSSSEEIESDLEIDREGVIEDKEVPNQEMGQSDVEPTDEMIDIAENKRSEGMNALSEGNFEEAIAAFTEAIKVNPSAPILAKRANCFLKMKRPKAAIQDCTRALHLNPDSALAYKIRGLSHKLLGDWEEAFTDLSTSNKIDFSEDAYEAMKEVEPKAKRINEHKRKYERKAQEKELRQRQRRVKKAREAYEKAKRDPPKSSGFGLSPEDMVSDPELLELLKDPEVMQAMNEIMVDQSKMAQYANNPKIRTVIEKMQSKFFQGGFSDIFGGGKGCASDDCCGGGEGHHDHHDSSKAAPPPSADDLD